ncbi:MAG: 1-acyl-sn-glycerol-3-phosphate acyltransferase [Verrucomicrobiales bacterium]|nr:1-acyl-sn-glycerol-3-phosphate acyltransferase [Verrucomicrobiales bacterium]
MPEIWRRPLPLLRRPLSRFLLRSILSLLARDVVGFRGIERLAVDRDPVILAINHSTRLEALLLPILFAFLRRGKLVRFIADWNFALIPGIATVLRAGETILLVRKPARPAFLNILRPWFERHGPAFDRAAALLRRGESIGIFPEGTTNRHPTHLLRGFDGAARLSLETGVPVVPVGVRFPGQSPDRPVRDRSPMEIFIGQPLHPPQHAASPSRDDVKAWHARIMQEIARLSGKSWNVGSTRRKHHGFE